MTGPGFSRKWAEIRPKLFLSRSEIQLDLACEKLAVLNPVPHPAQTVAPNLPTEILAANRASPTGN
jgi:hypothetical protein